MGCLQKLGPQKMRLVGYACAKLFTVLYALLKGERVFSVFIRPPVRSNGMTYKMLVMFIGRPEPPFRTGLCFTADVSFFRHAFSEVPRPIALKLCHMIRIWPYFITHSKNSGGAPPKKLGAKNMPNLGQFWTTSDFDREYLRKGSRYPKSADVTNYGNSTCV